MATSIDDFYRHNEAKALGYPEQSLAPKTTVCVNVNDAANDTESPISQLVALDLAALAAVPTDAHLDPRPQAPARSGDTLIPRPAQWMNAEWALKPFVFVSSGHDAARRTGHYRIYRCALHRRDGAPCNAELQVPIATVAVESNGRPPLKPFEAHLRDHHDIVRPMTCRSTWRTSLCDCGWECCDYYMAPCCFVGRLLYITDARSDDFVPSMTDGNACCGSGGRGVDVCVCWSAQTILPPMLCFPCYPDWQVRSRVLWLRNIQEDPCTTWLTVWMCAACSAMQVHRELRATGVQPGYICGPLASNNMRLEALDDVITRDDVVRSRFSPNARRNCTGTVVQRYGLVVQGTVME